MQNETGRCPYCGSEDVEEYFNGTNECNECGPFGNNHFII